MGRPKRPEAAAVGRCFGENLVELRRRAGLSQTATAERAGLHRTEISFLERALRVPRLDTLVRLAGALEADPSELLAGMAREPGPPQEGSP